MTQLPSTPSELWHEARQLLDEAVDGGGDSAGRLARVEALRAASAGMIQQADAEDQALLANAALFLEAITTATNPAPPTTLIGAADHLGWRILDLAEQVAAGEVAPEESRRRAAALREELEQLQITAEQQGEGPTIRSMMHDPWLELRFAELGGHSPTSLRMAQRRR